MKLSVNPQLQQALQGGNTPLSVFAKFKATPESASPDDVVTRVTHLTRLQAKYNFRDLDSVLHVSANPTFIKELIKQPEIVDASVVPQYTSALIPPVNPRDVPASAISEPAFRRRRRS
jgi:predicted component of type VI protein secretion system